MLAKQACDIRDSNSPPPRRPAHVCCGTLKSQTKMGSGLKHEDGLMLFHVERFESVCSLHWALRLVQGLRPSRFVPCIELLLGTGLEPPTSHRWRHCGFRLDSINSAVTLRRTFRGRESRLWFGLFGSEWRCTSYTLTVQSISCA